jgi:hypothetical protein
MSQLTMNQSPLLLHFPEVVDDVLDRITEALTVRASPARREAVARNVRAMVLGLVPGNVMQLMLAGKAVLFHALTINAAGDLSHDDTGTLKLRAQSGVVNFSRTMTRYLDTLTRLQAGPAKQLPPPAGKLGSWEQIVQDSETAEPGSEREAIRFQTAIEEAIPDAPEAPAVPDTEGEPEPFQPLNRQQRRRAERERARLARRAPPDRTVTNEVRQ